MKASKLIVRGFISVVLSGRPPPRVTWWRASKLLQESSEVSSSGKVRSDLILPRLSRNDLNSNLTCQASNTNLTVPVSKIIMLDLNCEVKNAVICAL
uniref:Ig-like domain-containing protein n=1 Tax=Strigamia maritima TaxID=126957 RepID=T1JJT1_STRMM